MFSSIQELLFPKGQLGGAGLIFGLLSLSGLFSSFMWAWDWFIGRFTVSITVPQSDDAWQWISDWLSKQIPVRHAADVTIETEEKDGHEDEWDIRYMPSVGATVTLIYKGRKVWMERVKEKDSNTISFSSKPKDSLKIYTMSASLAPLKELIVDAMQVSRELSQGMTKIFFPDGNNWSAPKFRPTRPISSVILGGRIKEEILEDAHEFLTSRDWYAQRGLPYRRGYLLYGPPGCGKSSFIFALAGKLGLHICVMNLSQPSMTDSNLQALMDDMPARCILLLEDVDAAFGTRQRPTAHQEGTEPVEGGGNGSSSGGEGVSSLSGPESRAGISFSGLLNALDGVAAAEGRVLFLTTNHIEKLDPALIRPGRVDMRSYFGLADTDQLRGLFLQFYPNEKALAERFARDVPPSKISMAALQGHFLAHKKSPKAALDNVLALVSDKAAPRTRDENEEAKDESPSLRLWRKKSL